MKVKIFFKLTALAWLALWVGVASAADTTKKMYGIQGDKLTIPTRVPSPSTYSVNGQTYTTKTAEAAKFYTKEGSASYYHLKFNGRKTASGDLYSSTQFTAAHKTLPLNSYALVTNLRNNRKVIVRINDRGPFNDSRLIDLSHAAAKEIGLITQGTSQVRIEALHVGRNGKISGAAAETLAKYAKTQEAADKLVLKSPSKKEQNLKTAKLTGGYKLKMLDLPSRKQADKLLTQLALNNINAEVNNRAGKYEIHFGPFDSKEKMTQVKTQLQKMAYNKPLIVYSY